MTTTERDIAWTESIVGRMHVKRIRQKHLAEELGLTNSYVSMLLAGKCNAPADMPQRMRDGIDAILARREEAANGEN